ncbi:MAG: SIMPL domain-containing protein [Flavobacteriales bacterium]|nr:SIMPL domain-containing protein [Flavobacteriales bacterium]
MRDYKVVIAIVLGLSLVISAYLIANAYKYKYESTQTISVTGLAKKDFEADLVRWTASFQRKRMDLKTASEELNKDREIVKQFLISKGINPKELVFDAVNIDKDYEYISEGYGKSQRVFTGYNLYQNFAIESTDLDKVESISREVSNLISQGIELNSNSPNYYYSKLEDLKLELIAQATDNARKRAENIADKSEASLGKLNNAQMGVFQITGQNIEEEFSYGGVYNTTSRKKTANITVKLIFSSK